MSNPGIRHEPTVVVAALGRVRLARDWLVANRATVFHSDDFRLAVLTFPVSFFVSYTSAGVRANGTAILLASAGMALAVVAVVLTAISILVSLANDVYARILERVPGGIPGAFDPYKVVAYVGGLATLVDLFSALAWNAPSPLPLSARVLQSFTLALNASLIVWAVVGTVQLVSLTAFHGVQRTHFLRGLGKAREILEDPDEHQSPSN